MKAEQQPEYERIAAEILQDQRIRITLFTFSVTTSAAIIGLSLQGARWGDLLVVAAAIYTIMIPSIILIYHYTRSINCLSEYLNIYHNEQWMRDFDQLTEITIPTSQKVTRTHRILVRSGAFSTEMAFTIAYSLMNSIIFLYGLSNLRGGDRYAGWVFALLFFVTVLVMKIFRPISKREYRELWRATVDSRQSDAPSQLGSAGAEPRASTGQ